ncbi:MAG TPA: hypothetical protein VFY91_09735 [Microbacterium sp.]|nr:hypothetical protein [Microbacterium sp.]
MTWRAFSSRFSPDPKAKAVQHQRLDDAARSFAAACERRSAADLAPLLSADVEAIVDAGGAVPAPAGAVRGRTAVSRLVVRMLSALSGVSVERQDVNGAPGLVVRGTDGVVGVISLGMRGTKIAAVWMVLNPDKLRHWDIR